RLGRGTRKTCPATLDGESSDCGPCLHRWNRPHVRGAESNACNGARWHSATTRNRYRFGRSAVYRRHFPNGSAAPRSRARAALVAIVASRLIARHGSQFILEPFEATNTRPDV